MSGPAILPGSCLLWKEVETCLTMKYKMKVTYDSQVIESDTIYSFMWVIRRLYTVFKPVVFR